MNRGVTVKMSFKAASDHVSFYKGKTPNERLEAACFIINSIFHNQKMNRNYTFSRMSNNIFNPDFFEFLQLLEKHAVRYVLVGGYAVILHGYVRSTGDIDLWLEKSKDNFQKLKKAYADFGAPIFPEDEFLNDKFDVWGIGTEPCKIEILTQADGLTFTESYQKRIFIEIEGVKIPYIDLEDLMKNKTASGRYKDLADIEQLNKNKEDE